MSLVANPRASQLALVVAAVGLVAGTISPPAAVGAPKSPAHTVAIDGTSFTPQTITVKAGSTVVWENKDPFPHTATSAEAGFDSIAIQPGKSWKYTATKKGEFSYVCQLHPTMKATLRVE